MTLKTQITADVSSVFINTDDFGVSITIIEWDCEYAVDAIVDQSLFETSNQFGVTSFETRDYLIESSTLRRMPERGVKIIEGDNTYIVTNPVGQPAWKYDDENRLIVRVHTTLTKVD